MKVVPLKKHWDIIAMFGVLLCCDTLAQIFFKIGANSIGEISLNNTKTLLTFIINLSQNIYVLFGFISIVIAFFTWLAVIAKIDLSKAHLITCIAYGTVPLGSMWLLDEAISTKQLIGICFIILGAFIASKNEVSS